jgi:DNA invertase Pin-like site-specific DNA recombinase
MLQIIGAVAEFERSFIQERVMAGLRNACAKGKKFRKARAQVKPGVAVRTYRRAASPIIWPSLPQLLDLELNDGLIPLNLTAE